MTPANQDFAGLYHELFNEEFPPQDPLFWEQPLDTLQTQTLVKPGSQGSFDYPEGYPAGPSTSPSAPRTPVVAHSASSSNKRNKTTPPSETSNQRKFRRTKKKSVDMTFSLREQTRTNPFAIAAQSIETILRPYGTIRDSDLLSLWSFPNQHDFACQFTLKVEGAFFSGSLLMPQLKDNLIPSVVARRLKPMRLTPYRSTYQLDAFTCYVHSEVSLATVVGHSEARVKYYVSDQIQIPIIGEAGMAALHLAYCPRLWCLITSYNDVITVGRIPIRTSALP